MIPGTGEVLYVMVEFEHAGHIVAARVSVLDYLMENLYPNGCMN